LDQELTKHTRIGKGKIGCVVICQVAEKPALTYPRREKIKERDPFGEWEEIQKRSANYVEALKRGAGFREAGRGKTGVFCVERRVKKRET